jgi:hypothetical protein
MVSWNKIPTNPSSGSDPDGWYGSELVHLLRHLGRTEAITDPMTFHANEHIFSHAGAQIGDLWSFQTDRMARLAKGPDGTFLGVQSGVLGYYTPPVGGSGIQGQTWNYMIYKDGSSYYAVDQSGTVTAGPSSTPDSVWTSTITGVDRTILVRPGVYDFTLSFPGVIFNHLNKRTNLIMPAGVTCRVANGYSGQFIRFMDAARNNTVGGGGIVKEIDSITPQKLWTAVQYFSDGVPEADGNDGVGECEVSNLYILQPGKGVEMKTVSSAGWLNTNYLERLNIYAAIEAITFTRDTVYSRGNHNGCTFNNFSRVNIQPDKGLGDSTYGVKNVGGIGNSFIACGMWDLPSTGVSMWIGPDAFGTTILGGHMTYFNYRDEGVGTVNPTDYYGQQQNVYYLRKKYGKWNLVAQTSGSDLLDGGVLLPGPTGTHSVVHLGTGIAGRLTTGSTINQQNGIRSSIKLTLGNRNPVLHTKVRIPTGHETTTRAFIGWSSNITNFDVGADPLNGKNGFGVFINTAAPSTNWRVMRNDGVGASVSADLQGPFPLNNNAIDFDISSGSQDKDILANNWRIVTNKGQKYEVFTTDVPDQNSVELALMVWIETLTGGGRALEFNDLWFEAD